MVLGAVQFIRAGRFQAARCFSSRIRAMSHDDPLGIGNRRTLTPEQQAAQAQKMKARQQRGLPERKPIPGVKDIIVVSSAKGGVGKSTTAVNLALAMGKHKRIGLLDADVFGPSLPIMMNLKDEQPVVNEREQLVPVENYGIQCMSMGFLVNPEDAIVWRGMMVMSAIQRLLNQVAWRDLDVLVIDMPPGTGDTQLSISQLVPVSGAVIVSTPQVVALADTARGIKMFDKVSVPVLGVVQNMAFFECPKCQTRTYIFGQDGAKQLCNDHSIDLLGELPLDIHIREGADDGSPLALALPDSSQAQAYDKIAEQVLAKLDATQRS
eukprot:TRINITY_DN9547_c0_g2_i1.p1 TRINITY_DN9547_c0_g2~~TRINITY_DN9547_c0_g2_i1.p1  ORF type:complete len:338 (+),score=57.56 TRINITY_DN9547_c0_g2_i1:48-1016(+)